MDSSHLYQYWEISLPAKQYWSYLKQYETYYLFYVTVFFLCNIICLPDIRVCVFICDTFQGHYTNINNSI